MRSGSTQCYLAKEKKRQPNPTEWGGCNGRAVREGLPEGVSWNRDLDEVKRDHAQA